MPLCIGDYLADTMHLSCTEHGAYLLLIMAYWKTRGPLPDEDNYLARTTRLSVAEWRPIRCIVAQFFTIRNRRWHHKRIESELKRRLEAYSARRESAIKTNKKRRIERSKSTVTDTVTVAVTDTYHTTPDSVSKKIGTHTHSVSGLAPPANGEKRVCVFEKLREGLTPLYQRAIGAHLSCLEQQLLAEVSQRPEAESELRIILSFYAVMKERKYFPNSFCRLLEKWTDVVDRARTYESNQQPTLAEKNGQEIMLAARKTAHKYL